MVYDRWLVLGATCGASSPTASRGLASGEVEWSLHSVFDCNEREFILSSRATAFSIVPGAG
jgi:hypothetical protein